MTKHGNFIERDLVQVTIIKASDGSQKLFDLDNSYHLDTSKDNDLYTLNITVDGNMLSVLFLRRDDTLDIDEYIYVWPMREIAEFRIVKL